MKFLAALAIASALHLNEDKAPHDELIQAGAKVAQYYGFDPANYVSQGYSWQVVGDVKLASVVSTFTATAPAAMQVVSAAHGWVNALRSNWTQTLNNTADANGLTGNARYQGSCQWNSSSTATYAQYGSSDCQYHRT